MGALGEKESFEGPLTPGKPAILLERLAHDALLQIIQLAGDRFRLLLNRRQQQGAQFWVFPFDQPGDLAIVRFKPPPAAQDQERPSGRYRDEQWKEPRCPPTGEAMEQDQPDARPGHDRPAGGQPAPQVPAPLIARDWL